MQAPVGNSTSEVASDVLSMPKNVSGSWFSPTTITLSLIGVWAPSVAAAGSDAAPVVDASVDSSADGSAEAVPDASADAAAVAAAPDDSEAGAAPVLAAGAEPVAGAAVPPQAASSGS